MENFPITCNGILELENFIGQQEGAFFGDTDNCPVKHSFAEGVYMREMFVPKGTLITGKIHNLKHINILASGTMEVMTEDGAGVITGPCSFVTRAGIMKVGLSKTDCIWINVLPNPDNCEDIEILEKRLVSESYQEHKKYLETKNREA